jgi:hypothetical protein
MAEQQELKIIISQDTVDFVRGLTLAGKKLDDFGKDGQFSIKSLNTALRALKKSFDTISDPLERARLGQKITEVSGAVKQLDNQFKGFKNTVEDTTPPTDNFNKNLKNTEDPARRARIAVYGLNQVVRDLPFGFIAISNNIPVLIDQFQALQQQEGSTRKALQAFSAGLIGAGGVSLALSAVISLITSAVQKYGSLQKAFDALIGTTNSLKIAKEALNNEVVKSNANATIEIGKIEFLVRAIQDNTLSQEQRVNAYKEFKKLAPGVIKDMTQENALTASGALLLQQRSQQLIQYIRLKGQEGALVKLLEKSNEKRFQAELDFITDVRKFSQGNLGLLEKITQYFVLVNDPANFLGIKTFVQDVGDATTQSEFFEQILNKVREQLLAIDPQVTGVEDYKKILEGIRRTQEKADRDAAKAQKDRAKAAKTALQDLLNADKEALQDRIELIKAQLDAQKALVDGLKRTDQGYLQEYSKLLSLQEELDRASAAIRVNDKKTLSQAFRAIDQEYYNKYLAEERRVNDAIKQERQKALKVDEKDRTTSINNIIKSAEAGIKRVIKSQEEISQEYIDNLRAIVEPAVNIFNKTLAPAIDSVFNAILNGQDAIKALGNSFKQLIVDLTATVIKAAALAAIISVISGGKIPFGATFRAGLSSRGIGDFLGNLLPSAGFGFSAAPISGPGGFGLSGQVVFVQRGADLVGVLNQTSARIGRIG